MFPISRCSDPMLPVSSASTRVNKSLIRAGIPKLRVWTVIYRRRLFPNDVTPGVHILSQIASVVVFRKGKPMAKRMVSRADILDRLSFSENNGDKSEPATSLIK
jgi:hypothetical protein